MSAKSTSQQRPQSSEGDSPAPRGQLESAEPTSLACNPCRKRKLRCSRELPACQHCRKTATECVYEAKRNKPGLKPGALDNVHRRLDALEHTVQRLGEGKDSCSRDDSHEGSAYRILALLAQELPNFIRDSSTTASAHSVPAAHKRRRIGGGEPITTASNACKEDAPRPPSLPPAHALDLILEAYFECIHPWIPMIHQSRFRRRLDDPRERPKLGVVLYAISLTAARFVASQHVAIPQPAELRRWVVSAAMDRMSVESLQALIILAFNDIGSGIASKAWSLIGSMTRTVEYLQLTIEHEETKREPLSHPFASLTPTGDWTENEERRRVFWNVFLLDRFCSVAMGWHTSLTSDDVHRRLPCDGILWRKQDPVMTPFFGIWDKAAARLGKPIAFLPSEPSAVNTAGPAEVVGGPRSPLNHATAHSPSSQDTLGTDITTMGAYAYCIEATESLSRVTSHFLQQRIDWRDGHDVGLWLTRFKELDLRLVHWKMFLPHKWKAEHYLRATVGNLGPGSTALVMDPNLTLAHVTHNTSMILLHQPIAFPPAALLPYQTRLPSACSVETCLAAATEIATITTKYLESTASGLPVAHQFAFCVYIAARVLLVDWQHGYMQTQLSDHFWTLVRALDEFSARWRGSGGGTPSTGSMDIAVEPALCPNHAAKYAQKLRHFHAECLQNPEFKVNVAGYTAEINHSATSPVTTGAQAVAERDDPYQIQVGRDRLPVNWGIYGPSQIPGPPLMRDQQGGGAPFASANAPSSGQGGNMLPEIPNLAPDNSLGSISQALLDQQFGEMDRIISYEDGSMFVGTMDACGGW
ncbi:hypothetical protein N657DRAFT_583002 [Parathielavia appendiculata]|uniref:Zn(2)-C6 fungal-type domain-containing protein n=1 Tax=Parathielavia appendiculata TaxID=2587402 RepID=A0AAN6YYG3_9PEZI|nr:hypothetical protein N657DRAFT_583002 [Parathielavia appendiculata]